VLYYNLVGIMFYAVGRELFSGQSPSGVYSRAFSLCRKHEKVYSGVMYLLHIVQMFFVFYQGANFLEYLNCVIHFYYFLF